MGKVSIVVPCFNEERTVDIFYSTITPVLCSLEMDYEIIYVNDGSRDKTMDKLKELAKSDLHVKVISFSRNFGQQAAILCGYRIASGDCVLELDVDLQDPVDIIPVMVQKWKDGYDIVHGRRIKRRGESLFKKISAHIYYKFLKRISKVSIPTNTGDFKLYDRKVIDVLVSFTEKNKYLRGLAAWVGFKQTFVDFERNERIAGETKYTLKKMVALARTGILSNSTWPLTISFKFGVFGLFLSIVCYLLFIILSCQGISIPLTAYLFPTMVVLTSILSIFNSLSNLYIEKTYEEVQNRPEYIVDEKINFEGNNYETIK